MISEKEFHALQEAKIERAKRLLNIVTRIGAAEIAGEREVLEKGIHILADHLPLLLDKIKAQQKLCGKDNQCIALIDEEISALSGRNKELGTSLIEHVRQAERGIVRLQVFPVSQALILILGREKSLKKLYAAA
ncbi:MAG: hypothetical protein QW165_01415 [Candidatus Woesearchaeota archaeon]